MGPYPPPAQAGVAKFGSVLSSSPYLVLQVIGLRHKGGHGPLAQPGRCRARMVRAGLGAGGWGLGAAGRPTGWGGEWPGQVPTRDGKGIRARCPGMPWRGPLPTHSVAGQQEGRDAGQGHGHQAGPARLFQCLLHVRASPDPGVQGSECPAPLHPLLCNPGVRPLSLPQDSPASCLRWGGGCSHWRL